MRTDTTTHIHHILVQHIGQLFIRYQADFYRSPPRIRLGTNSLFTLFEWFTSTHQNEQCNMFADDSIIYSIVAKVFLRFNPSYKWPLTVSNTEKSSVMLIGKKTQIRDNNLNIYINYVLVNETNCITSIWGFLLTLFYHGMCNVIIYVDIFLEKMLYCAEKDLL